MNEDQIRMYMGYQWLYIEDDAVVVGINEEGTSDLDSINSIDLPKEKDEVSADEVCGVIETDEGELEIYSPVDGKVIEINAAILENPNLILEDSMGDGWILKIEPDNIDDLDNIESDEEDEEED